MPQSSSNNRRTALSRRGAATVELAFCLPIMLLFLFASYELARANMIRHAADAAAYEGARIAILPNATTDRIENAVDFVLSSVGVVDYTVTITPPTLDNSVEKVRVEVAIPFRTNTTVSAFFVNDPNFLGHCELSRETF